MYQPDAQLRGRILGQMSQHSVFIYDQFRLPLSGKIFDVLC
jgi:hypothetical protein